MRSNRTRGSGRRRRAWTPRSPEPGVRRRVLRKRAQRQGVRMPKVSIGSWAFGIYSERPLPFDRVLDRIAELKFDGIELGAFDPHPDPFTCSTPGQRDELRHAFEQRGLEVSAVAADFGSEGFLRTSDPSAYLAAVDRNLEFCHALGAGRLIVNT